MNTFVKMIAPTFIGFFSVGIADAGGLRDWRVECSCLSQSASACSQVDVTSGEIDVECIKSEDLCQAFEAKFQLNSPKVRICAEPFFSCQEFDAELNDVDGVNVVGYGETIDQTAGFTMLFDSLRYRAHFSVRGELNEFFGTVTPSCSVKQ